MRQLANPRGSVDELDFSPADGRDAFITLRGAIMVVRHLGELNDIQKFGPNLSGNVEGDREGHRRVDLLLTPTMLMLPFPVEQNYPQTIAGRKMETYVDWIAPTLLVTLASLPAASVPCGRTPAGLPVGLQHIGPRVAERQILRIVQETTPLGWPPPVQPDG